MLVKVIEVSEYFGVIYVKVSILKLYIGSVFRFVIIFFVNNIFVKVYCGCVVGKSGLCCYVIVLLIEFNYYCDNKKFYFNMLCIEKF